MSAMSNHRIILWSTGLVLVGLFLSVIGLILHEFTPATEQTWAPAITAIATLGLTLGGVLVMSRSKDAGLQGFARRMWRVVACASAVAIVAASIVCAFLVEPIIALIVGLVALQGPIGAWFVSEQLGK